MIGYGLLLVLRGRERSLFYMSGVRSKHSHYKAYSGSYEAKSNNMV